MIFEDVTKEVEEVKALVNACILTAKETGTSLEHAMCAVFAGEIVKLRRAISVLKHTVNEVSADQKEARDAIAGLEKDRDDLCELVGGSKRS